MPDTTITTATRRPLGTMIAYGFAGGDVGIDLGIASRLGAEVVEALPDWKNFPDPDVLRRRVADFGLAIHSAHGCWGGRSIRAARVDLSHPDAEGRPAGLDDLRLCVDWLAKAGGRCLVVHPGGLSDPARWNDRRGRLGDGLVALADHASGTGVVVCVENMPPGVHPGSRMADLAGLVAEIDRPELALALDTGHAHLNGSAADETLAAGAGLRTTHVHDNDGRLDAHLPPGSGSVDWAAWVRSLDAIGYEGPIMLECIRHLRSYPESLSEDFLGRLRRMMGLDR